MATTVDIPSEDAIWIRDKLYCKTPQGLQITLDTLRGLGYTIEDLRDPKGSYSSTRKGEITAEEMELHGHALWFAHLETIRYGKCNSCHSYIKTFGIHSHGHTCEVCDAVTYLELVEGSGLKFRFEDDGRGWLEPDVIMNVKRWDVEEGYLYLERTGREDVSAFTFDAEQTNAYLAANTDKWEAVEEDGRSLIKVRHQLRLPVPNFTPETVLDVKDSWGSYINYTSVKLWEGKEFNSQFPVPESIHLYEPWHWAPLDSSPTLHAEVIEAAGPVANLAYYTRDRQQPWRRDIYKVMGIFLRHFTTLDADKWDRESQQFRLDPLGAIIDVAQFCDPESRIANCSLSHMTRQDATRHGYVITIDQAEEFRMENGEEAQIRAFANRMMHDYRTFGFDS